MEVVPGLVEVDAAVPHLSPAVAAVALREAGAGEIVIPGWLLDRQAELVKGSEDP